MILWHWTLEENMESIMEHGLRVSGIGIIYLTPIPHEAVFGDVLLEVETASNRLSSFEDCREWEVFCWGNIPAENIKQIKLADCVSL